VEGSWSTRSDARGRPQPPAAVGAADGAYRPQNSEFACDVVGLDNTQAATTATEHLVEKGFEAMLFLSEPLGSVNTRRERLSAFRADPRHTGIVAENAEVPLNDGAMLDNVLRQFHSRHRGMRKAVIPPTAR
jgi:LacI family kdg operon repressor